MKVTWYILLYLWTALLSMQAQNTKELVILHTNDIHSYIEPITSTDAGTGAIGGLINRKSLIDSIRVIYPELLLLDAGDFVQGTPYYNLFKGRIEVEGMNLLKYDAVTLGNHEFDYGLDTLQMIIRKLYCPVIVCNYNFTGTPMEGIVSPYIILKRKGIKIGIIGAGIDPEGLIQKDKYAGMKFLPVIETVNHYATLLKKKKKCDLVICLTHIGHHHDLQLAKQSEDIDLIIGGHSHTFLDAPVRIPNQNGTEVLIYQAGKQGTQLGEIKVKLAKGRR